MSDEQQQMTWAHHRIVRVSRIAGSVDGWAVWLEDCEPRVYVFSGPACTPRVGDIASVYGVQPVRPCIDPTVHLVIGECQIW